MTDVELLVLIDAEIPKAIKAANLGLGNRSIARQNLQNLLAERRRLQASIARVERGNVLSLQNIEPADR